MNQSSTFQIVALGVFGLFILIGVGVFAVFGGLFGNASIGMVTIWGTPDQAAMDYALEELRAQDKSFENVNYVQKDPAVYNAELLNALAAGRGPDLVLLSQDQIQSFRDKVVTIPYGSVSQRTFLSTFVDEGQLFINKNGILAMPLFVDPLVMYWNRDLFSGAGIATPPAYWKELIDIAPHITSLDASKNLRRSAVALGQWQNIDNAKPILSALFMQAGDFLVGADQDGNPVSVFGTTPENAAENPAQSALRFYTEFTNPSQSVYSWNRTMPRSGDAFAAGDLGLYFGFASEYGKIVQRNPNLHFDVAVLPQIEGAPTRITYGRLTGVAITRTSQNPNGALTIALKLTGAPAAAVLASKANLAPARRDLLKDTPDNAIGSVFVRSTLIARGWNDPDPAATSNLFQRMVESVISGQSQPAEAVNAAARDFSALFPRVTVTPAPAQ